MIFPRKMSYSLKLSHRLKSNRFFSVWPICNDHIDPVEKSVIVKEIGKQPKFDHKIHYSCTVVKYSRITSGSHKFIFSSFLSSLQNILIQKVQDLLIYNNFKFITVPEVVHKCLIEKTGFSLDCPENKTFNLDNDMMLIGTSETPLAFYAAQKIYEDLCAISNCYRQEAEGSKLDNELYRLKQFKKIEMFGIISPNQTKSTEYNGLSRIIKIQEYIISALFDNYRLIKMANKDLGLSAACKFDIESFFPFKKFYGELTSASNCTDFQSRKFGINYKESNSGHVNYCHT
ncbi:MAG: seryl-tRNA synthetase, partial [Paramarteilia canceri]